jgi:hypothetical protein
MLRVVHSSNCIPPNPFKLCGAALMTARIRQAHTATPIIGRRAKAATISRGDFILSSASGYQLEIPAFRIGGSVGNGANGSSGRGACDGSGNGGIGSGSIGSTGGGGNSISDWALFMCRFFTLSDFMSVL